MTFLMLMSSYKLAKLKKLYFNQQKVPKIELILFLLDVRQHRTSITTIKTYSEVQHEMKGTLRDPAGKHLLQLVTLFSRCIVSSKAFCYCHYAQFSPENNLQAERPQLTGLADSPDIKTAMHQNTI